MISSDRYCSSCGAANPPAATVCFACGLSLKITAPLPHDVSNHPLLQQRYRILTQLGKGGSSAVYEAEDTLLNDHLVAIKAISLRGLKPQEMIEVTEAFNREILLLSGLKHPSVSHIYNSFSDSESWYLVIDFIEGTTLEKHLEDMRDGQLPIGEVLEIGLMLCTVLDYLHTHQPPVIFRDLKPANVMLKPDGRIALIDFGIARHFKPGQAKDTMPFGSPGYAAPEQYGRAQTTPRADIYSLGVMLHQLLTGDDPSQTPFRFAPLQFQDQPALAGLETLIMQMVEMDVDKRPESIAVVKEELQRIAREWSAQHRYGVKERGPYSNPPPSAFWRALLPPPEVTGVPLAVGGKEQMSLLQSPAPGQGSSSASSSAYWSTPKPPKKHNRMAVASFVFGILGILTPLFLCPASGYLLAQHAILVSVILLMLSMLAVICGHIGNHRAKTVHGLGESYQIAVAGLVMGYLFGAIYLAFVLTLLFTLLFGFFTI
jgi:serine/threonine protein kinase